MKYKVITVSAVSGMSTNFDHASLQLSQLVNQQILEGWQPLGGVATGVTQQTKEPYLLQAMLHE